MKPDLALVRDFRAWIRRWLCMTHGIRLGGFFGGTFEVSGLKINLQFTIN